MPFPHRRPSYQLSHEISAEGKWPAYQLSHEISRKGKMDSIATFEKNFAKLSSRPRHAQVREGLVDVVRVHQATRGQAVGRGKVLRCARAPALQYATRAASRSGRRSATHECHIPFRATEIRRALRPCADRPSIARASSVGCPRDLRALKPPCHTQDARC